MSKYEDDYKPKKQLSAERIFYEIQYSSKASSPCLIRIVRSIHESSLNLFGCR